jgi:hypothetical protein
VTATATLQGVHTLHMWLTCADMLSHLRVVKLSFAMREVLQATLVNARDWSKTTFDRRGLVLARESESFQVCCRVEGPGTGRKKRGAEVRKASTGSF